jgi:hypothetical protein
MSVGSVIGGILGGVGGSMVGAPAAGYALGSGVGGMIEGGIKANKANKMNIDEVSPMQTSIMADIRQRRAAMEAGTYFMPQQQQLMQMGAGGMRRAVGATGGSPAATISALNMINRGTGRNLNELYGQMQQGALNLLNPEMQMANQLYGQRFSLQSYAKQQALHDAMRIQRDSMANLGGFMADPNRAAMIGKLFNGIMGKGGTNDTTQVTYPSNDNVSNSNNKNLYSGNNDWLYGTPQTQNDYYPVITPYRLPTS